MPTSIPPLIHVRELNSTQVQGTVSVYNELIFEINAATNVSFVIELLYQASSKLQDSNPNIFLTQWNHRYYELHWHLSSLWCLRSWALRAASRGYLACRYPGSDTRDAGDDFEKVYPTATWKKIVRRAWVASRTLDFLAGTGNKANVSITGHSRNGKQSFIAAAFDERITSVVGSSPGTPIAAPVRFSSSQFVGETVQYVTSERGWWLPSLATYYGREHELPIDGHAVLALIAPRHALFASGHNDYEGDVSFASERNYLAAREAYRLFDKEENLRISYRSGNHHGFLDLNVYFGGNLLHFEIGDS